MKKSILPILLAVVLLASFFYFSQRMEQPDEQKSAPESIAAQTRTGSDAPESAITIDQILAQTGQTLESAKAKGTRQNFAELLQGADALGVEDGETRSDGSFVRRSLYRVRNFHYPVVLVEEVMTPGQDGDFTSSRISAIVGDHAMIRLPANLAEQDLQAWIDNRGYTLRSRLKTAPILIVADESGKVGAVDGIIEDFTQTFLADQPDWDRRGVAEADNIAFFSATPDDPDFDFLWGQYNDGSFIGSVPGADIDAPSAWEIGTGTSSVIVAVIDSGAQLDHPDLVNNLWINSGEIPGNGIDDDSNGFIDDVNGWDFVGNSWNPLEPLAPDNDPEDQNGHGTHVAGTIGATGNNGIGVVGVNWTTQLMTLKIGGSGPFVSFSAAIEATNYAVENEAAMINNSYGGAGRPEDDVPPILFEDAIRNAAQEGVLFIASAGNDESNNDSAPKYPASYPLSNIISVAASDWADQLADFSNFGATSVDLAAPGDVILSTYTGSSYAILSGTSMAAPQVTGAAALLKSINPSLAGSSIRTQMFNTVTSLSSLNGVVQTGGRLNLQAMVGAPKLPRDGGGGGEPVGNDLAISNLTAFDDPAVSPHNNGDGIFNPGELLAIRYTITNLSDETKHVIYSDINATPTTILGSIPVGFDGMDFGNRALGTLQPGQSRVDSNLRVYCYGNTPTPYIGTYSIALESGTPDSRSSQSFSVDLVAGKSVRISGSVRGVPGNAPISDATVSLVGSVDTDTYTVTANSNGSFSALVPGDVYTLVATSKRYGPSDELDVDAKNKNVSGLALKIGVPLVSVDPESFSVSVEAGETDSEPMVITNDGDIPTTWLLAGDESAISGFDPGNSVGAITPLYALPDWLSLDKSVGIIDPDASETVTLTFSPSIDNWGTLETTLILTTTDPLNPEILIPVSMEVTGDLLSGFPIESYRAWLETKTGRTISSSNSVVSPDLDGDGLRNLVDFVFGDPEGVAGISVELDADGTLEFQIQEDVPSSLVSVFASTDLKTWEELPEDSYTTTESPSSESGLKKVVIGVNTDDSAQFYRLKFVEP